MYFEGELEADSYGRLKAKLKGDLDRARQVFELAEQGDGGGSVTPEAVKNAADVLEALPQVWARADASRDAEALHDLIGSIAPVKVTFEGSVVRTMGEGPQIGLQPPKTQDADSGDGSASCVAPRVGFEPTTLRLTAACSTAELPRNK
jgi:hypothetical protein